MSDRKKLCDAVKLIAWGFVFIFLDFNINTKLGWLYTAFARSARLERG